MHTSPLNSVSFYEWLINMDSCIMTAISACSPRGWDENHISYSWLSAITGSSTLQNIQITDVPTPFSIAWDAYKARGVLEENHGDIAFLVRLTFPRGASTLGVGFLEAKRIYSDGTYQSIQWKQLEHQAKQSANHKVLLYDDKPILAAANNLIAQGFCRMCFPGEFSNVLASVAPTQHVLALRRLTRELNELSLPLSYQICCRYLRGFDLDYEPKLVQAVESGTIPGIRYLFVAHAVMGSDELPSTRGVGFNREHFRPLLAER